MHSFPITFEKVYNAEWAWWCLTAYSGMAVNSLAWGTCQNPALLLLPKDGKLIELKLEVVGI